MPVARQSALAKVFNFSLTWVFLEIDDHINNMPVGL